MGGAVDEPVLRDDAPGVVAVERSSERMAIRDLPAFHFGTRGAHRCIASGHCLGEDLPAISRVHRRVGVAMKHDEWCQVVVPPGRRPRLPLHRSQRRWESRARPRTAGRNARRRRRTGRDGSTSRSRPSRPVRRRRRAFRPAYGAAHDLPSALAAMKGQTSSSAGRDHDLTPLIVFHGDADTTVHPRNGGG